MSFNQSRKQFFAKLFGVAAVAGVLPKLLAKTVTSATEAEKPRETTPAAFAVRTDPRAVARQTEKP